MATAGAQHDSADERRRAARNVLIAAVAQQSDGRVDTAALMDEHPELMPELRVVCDEFFAIQQLDTAAGTSDSASDAHRDGPALVPGYNIVRLIRHGGQAAVYEAVRAVTQQRVALKIFFGGDLIDERERKRFNREVESLASITHPNVVPILDCGTTGDGTQYLATPYIAGRTLDVFIKEWWVMYPGEQAVPVELLALFVRIARAVQATHSKSIVHRDLKPSNIIIDDAGEPYILDFGLARRTVGELMGADRSISLTTSGQFVGSLNWASPEQVAGNAAQVDCKTDVYGLGLILYFMLSGQMPYRTNGRLADIINSIVNADPVPLSAVLSERSNSRAQAKAKRSNRWRRQLVDPVLEAIVTKALSKRSELRYASAGIFADDIERFIAGERTLARPAHSRGWMRRTAAAAVGIMALLSLLTFARLQPTQPVVLDRAPDRARVASAAPLGAVPFRGHSYMTIESYLNFDDAVERARQLGGYLVEIGDAAEQQLVSTMLHIGTPKGRSGKQYWLGVQGNEDAWSTGRGEPLTFENWHPHTRNDGRDLAASTSGYVWYRMPKDGQLMLIVEWDGLPPRRVARPDMIPSDTVRYGGSAYKVFTTLMSWPDAREACQSMGGDLVSIGSEAEAAFLRSVLRETEGHDEAWVGAQFFEQYLGWVDGTDGDNIPLWEQGSLYAHECIFLNEQDWGVSLGVLPENERAFICEWHEGQQGDQSGDASGS